MTLHNAKLTSDVRQRVVTVLAENKSRNGLLPHYYRVIVQGDVLSRNAARFELFKAPPKGSHKTWQEIPRNGPTADALWQFVCELEDESDETHSFYRID